MSQQEQQAGAAEAALAPVAMVTSGAWEPQPATVTVRSGHITPPLHPCPAPCYITGRTCYDIYVERRDGAPLQLPPCAPSESVIVARLDAAAATLVRVSLGYLVASGLLVGGEAQRCCAISTHLDGAAATTAASCATDCDATVAVLAVECVRGMERCIWLLPLTKGPQPAVCKNVVGVGLNAGNCWPYAGLAFALFLCLRDANGLR